MVPATAELLLEGLSASIELVERLPERNCLHRLVALVDLVDQAVERHILHDETFHETSPAERNVKLTLRAIVLGQARNEIVKAFALRLVNGHGKVWLHGQAGGHTGEGHGHNGREATQGVKLGASAKTSRAHKLQILVAHAGIGKAHEHQRRQGLPLHVVSFGKHNGLDDAGFAVANAQSC